MKRTAISAITVLISIFLTGCYETEQYHTINPDGTGKVVLTARLQPQNFNLMAQDATPEDTAKSTVENILEKSDGVDAWKDVAFTSLDDGRLEFKGTAYYKDISQLEFHNLGNNRISFNREGDDKIVLQIEVGSDSKEDAPAKKDLEKISDEELDREIDAEKAKYQKRIRPMMAAILSNMKEDIFFDLPGQIESSTNLEQDKNGTLHFQFDGARLIDAMDRMVADENAMRKQLRAGGNVMKDGPAASEELNKMLFGAKGPIKAVSAAPFKAQFDYRAEVAAAKANYPAMIKKLGLAPVIPVVESAQGEGLKNIRVGGVRLIKFSDQKAGVRPFNYDKGFTLALVADLSGAAVSVEGGETTKAIADDGSSLLPEREWDRKINFPRLSKDMSTVTFEVKMNMPGEKVKGIREIAGKLNYLVAEGSRTVDLGITDFDSGATGSEFGAVLDSVEKSKWNDGEVLVLKLDMNRDMLKDIKVYDDQGGEIEISSTSKSWTRSKATIKLGSQNKLPERGKIVLEVYEGQAKYEVPFKIENTTLLGNPM